MVILFEMVLKELEQEGTNWSNLAQERIKSDGLL
jgi:hypothetical protein